METAEKIKQLVEELKTAKANFRPGDWSEIHRVEGELMKLGPDGEKATGYQYYNED